MVHGQNETASIDFRNTGKRKTFSSLCIRFAEKTSMQGVPYINNSKLKTAKLAWTFLLISAIGAMTYHLYFLCTQFFLWPKITIVSLNFSDLVLPAVTVCNVNPFMRSNLGNVSKPLRDLVKSMDPGRFKPSVPQDRKPKPGRQRRFVEDLDDFNSTQYIEYDYHDLFKNFEGLGPKNKNAEVTRIFQELYMQEKRTLRRHVGHSIHNMLISCSFDGRTCYSRNFTIFQTKEYGNCYTIQSPFFSVRLSGPSSGLELVLLTENNDYLEGIAQGYGARVVIHPQGILPYPQENGFFVSSSTETHVALKLVSITRIGQPHGKCSKGDLFKTRHNLNYSRKVCESVCEHDLMISRCGCYSSLQEEILVYARKQRDYKLCRNKKELICQAEVEEEIEAKSDPCVQTCYSPCQEDEYVKTISQRQWPTDEYTNVLIQSVCEKTSRHPSFINYCQDLLQQDKRRQTLQFLKLVVYFEDLNYESIQEKEEIETAQFASDVGGALGLWIGLSALSVFELFQLCVEMCNYGCHKCCKNEHHKSREYVAEEQTEVPPRIMPTPLKSPYDTDNMNLSTYHSPQLPSTYNEDMRIRHDGYWDRHPQKDKSLYIYRGRQYSS